MRRFHDHCCAARRSSRDRKKHLFETPKTVFLDAIMGAFRFLRAHRVPAWLVLLVLAVPASAAQKTSIVERPTPTPVRTPFPWPGGAACAVSLSYDDGAPVHHQRVAPLLDQHGLRATFYLSVTNLDSPDAWKSVAARGHELGNHALFHPCRRESNGYAWLAEDYDLKTYSPRRLHDELSVANLVLYLLDGGRPRTYGNNCTNLTIGRDENEQPMDPILAEMFVAARGTVTNKPVDPRRPVFTRLGHYSGDGKTFAQLRAEIEQARVNSEWIIYMFHGVGEGTHALFIPEEEHRQLVEWLATSRSAIWTAPIVEVATRLKAKSGT
jgi:peptidoglycan-N-acetylglucosamine deacetylase